MKEIDVLTCLFYFYAYFPSKIQVHNNGKHMKFFKDSNHQSTGQIPRQYVSLHQKFPLFKSKN